MLIWTRLGFLVAVFVFGSSLAANLITNQATGSSAYWDAHRWTVGVALLVAALLSWLVGIALDRKGSRGHTLFFIRMHWWGPLLAIGGLAVIVLDRMGKL